MALSYSQNWDGVTAPAIPSGWNVDSQFVTSSSTSYTASNSLSLLSGSSGVLYWAAYGTDDGSSTDPVVIAVSSWVKLTNFSGSSGEYAGGVVFRGSASTFNNTNTTQYLAFISSVSVTDVYKVVFAKVVNGTYTEIASVATTDFGLFLWYQVAVDFTRSSGGANSTSVAVRRSSDNWYMNSSGGFQSGSAYALTSSDNSISQGGYGGVFAEAASSERVWLDSYSFVSSPPSTSAVRRPNLVPRPANTAYWL